MRKYSKSLKILFSFLFLFSLVFFIASEHSNPDCSKVCTPCDDNLTIENNTQSAVKLTLSSSETEVVTVTSNSKISFKLKKGVYKWIAYDKNTNKILSSGIINFDDNNKQTVIKIEK